MPSMRMTVHDASGEDDCECCGGFASDTGIPISLVVCLWESAKKGKKNPEKGFCFGALRL